MITFDTVLTFSIGGIVGFIIKTIISDKLARDRSIEAIRLTEFKKSTSDFRLAFLDLLLYLKEGIEPEGFTDFVSYLHRLYPKHAAAIISFTPYLNKAEVTRINEAWFNYKFPNGIAKDEAKKGKEEFPLDDYASISESEKIALEKIETLLSIGIHNEKIL